MHLKTPSVTQASARITDPFIAIQHPPDHPCSLRSAAPRTPRQPRGCRTDGAQLCLAPRRAGLKSGFSQRCGKLASPRQGFHTTVSRSCRDAPKLPARPPWIRTGVRFWRGGSAACCAAARGGRRHEGRCKETVRSGERSEHTHPEGFCKKRRGKQASDTKL